MRTCRPGPLTLRVTVTLAILLLLERLYHYRDRLVYRRNDKYAPLGADVKPDNVHLVVASRRSDDTSWLATYFAQWQHFVYVMDDPSANLTVPVNKGHESAAYLTYIIDNYDSIPDYVVFLHGERYQWHNDDPLYDGVRVLERLRFAYVARHGFASLRCTWKLGCPVELRARPGLAMDAHRALFATDRDMTEAAYPQAFLELFPGDPVPAELAVPCGAQFAAARSALRARPRADYVRFRDWLYATSLPDRISGRILEYAWHVILGAPPVECPDAGRCFCEKFGLCDLSCAVHSCKKRYWFRFGALPSKWPAEGPGTDGWPPLNWADP